MGAKVYDVTHNCGGNRKKLPELTKTALKKMNIKKYEKRLKNITTEEQKPIKNGYWHILYLGSFTKKLMCFWRQKEGYEFHLQCALAAY